MTLERTVERREYWTDPGKRVSWGAIFGGGFVAIGVMIILGTLGVAIGMDVIEPASGDTPDASTFGIVGGIFWIVSGLLAMFAGGMAAAKLSGRSRGLEGPLHGVVTWAIVTVATLFLVTTTIGALIGGAFGVLKTGAKAVGAGAGVVAKADLPDVSPVLDQLELPEITWSEVRTEVREILSQTGKPALDPNEIEGDLDGARDEAKQAIDSEDLPKAEQDLDAALNKLYRSARDGIDAADRDAVVNVLVARTDMSRDEASQMVDKWADRLDQAWSDAKAGMSSAVSELKQGTAEAVETGAEGISDAAWAIFAYFLLTLLAAGAGGLLGAPSRRAHESRTVRTTHTTPTSTTATRPPPPPGYEPPVR
jgi:hypothetical protein